MKRLLIILSASMLSIGTFAQQPTNKVSIAWGKPFKQSAKKTLSDIVGVDETGFYTIEEKYNYFGKVSELSMSKFDNNQNKVLGKEIDLSQGNHERELEGILQVENKLVLFSSYPNKKTKNNLLYRQVINKNNLNPDEDIQTVASIDFTGENKNNSGNYGFEFSTDKSKILVYYNKPYDKGESEAYGFHILNSDISELWQKEVILPYKEELFEVQDYEVSTKGTVYVLGRVFTEKRKNTRSGKPNFHYVVLEYAQNGQTNEYPVTVKGKYLIDMNVAITATDDILCSGYYSDQETYSIRGSYFLSIDHVTKSITSDSYQAFPIDFLTQHMNKIQAKKTKKKAEKGKDVELYGYDLRDLVIREDGGAILIGEQFRVYVVAITTTNNGVSSTTYQYHYLYNDIIVTNISPEGEIEWSKKIAKRQHTINDGGAYSSYALMVVKDKLYFIFNDNVENLNYDGVGKPALLSKGKKSYVVLVEMDGEGNQTREPLFSAKETGAITKPKVCEQISPEEMVLYAQKGKKNRFAQLTFVPAVNAKL